MTDRYRFTFNEQSVYAHVMTLLESYRLDEGEVVIDLGCGFGAIAEPVQALGLVYVGVDGDESGPAELVGRGFSAAVADLQSPDLAGRLTDLLAGRRLAAVTMIDSIEHLPAGADVLAGLRSFALAHGSAPLILSVPNVSHFDLGVKLLAGRWDVTPTGILDETHVGFFSAERLAEVTGSSGWAQLGAYDFELHQSDQHFPADLTPLVTGTPVNLLLRSLNDAASEHGRVNQFVRAFSPSGIRARPGDGEGPERSEVFLTVLVRTQGTRLATLHDTLMSLAAQSDDGFEVLLLCHDMSPALTWQVEHLLSAFDDRFRARVRLVPVAGGGRARPLNVGLREAVGTYVSVVDDDDVVLGHWVETFRALAARDPGHVLRTMVATQDVGVEAGEAGQVPLDRPRSPYPAEFDLVDHVLENRTPSLGYAIPRSCYRDFHIAYDESLPVLEDWDMLMRTALVCGVTDSGQVTALYRRWQTGGSSSSVHTPMVWASAQATVFNKLNEQPFVLGPGSIELLHRLGSDRRQLRDEHHSRAVREVALAAEVEQWKAAAHAAAAEVAALRASTSWRVAAPVRRAGDTARRITRRKR